MANPRQRRKARSSSHKPVSHSKRAKSNLKKVPPIRGPKVLQDAWDKKKTVRQNYARLGLAASLDPATNGGVEPSLVRSDTSSPSHPANSLKEDMPIGFGRIIRDDAGRVIGAELNDDKPGMQVDSDDVDDVDSRIDPDVRRKWVTDFTQCATGVTPQNVLLIKELEDISAPISGSTTLSIRLSGIGSRHISNGEVKYLDPLVKKHGDNLISMAADLKLNPEQRTVGQLRRALRKAGLVTLASYAARCESDRPSF